MTDDPRGRLLAAANHPEPSAMTVLAHALDWAAASLGSADAAAPVDLRALELVIGLDDALQKVPSLASHASTTIQQARVGPDVEHELARRQGDLQALAKAVASARERRDAAATLEAEHRAREQQYQQLQDELAGLETLRRRVEAIPEIENQKQVLERRLQAMRAPVKAADAALVETATEVITLRREKLGDLEIRLHDLLTAIGSAEQEYAATYRRYEQEVVRLRSATERFEKLQGIAEDLKSLQAYAQADEQLAAALSQALGREIVVTADATGVQAVTAEVRLTLTRVDHALAAALEAYEKTEAAARRVLSYSEHEPPGVTP